MEGFIVLEHQSNDGHLWRVQSNINTHSFTIALLLTDNLARLAKDGLG